MNPIRVSVGVCIIVCSCVYVCLCVCARTSAAEFFAYIIIMGHEMRPDGPIWSPAVQK